MTVTARTVKGIWYSSVSNIIRLSIQLLVTAVLAHLIAPAEFGLFAMVVVFSNLAMILRDLGLGAAIVQKKETDDEMLSSAFWMNVLFGAVLAVLGLAMAGPIAGFYGEARLLRVICVLSPMYFIWSFGIVQTALLIKKLDFRRLAFIEISSVLISGAAAVTLAFLGFGVWSLVWQAIVAAIINTAFVWLFFEWKPKPVFKPAAVKGLFGFGMPLVGFNLVNYFSRNFDNMIIGKFLGAGPLGFYDLAYKILLFPVQNIAQVIGRVMFPSMSLVNHDMKKVRLGYFTAVRAIALVTFPLLIWIFIMAHEIIYCFFGRVWADSVPVLRVLSLVGILQSVATINGTVYQSLARTGLQFKIGMIFSSVLCVSFVIGLRCGIVGVAACYAAATLIITYPGMRIPLTLMGAGFSRLIEGLRPIAASTAVMAGTVLFTRLLCIKFVPNEFLTLACSIAAAMISYLFFMLRLDRDFLIHIADLVKQINSKGTA